MNFNEESIFFPEGAASVEVYKFSQMDSAAKDEVVDWQFFNGSPQG